MAFLRIMAFMSLIFGSSGVLAAIPKPWEIGFQSPATPTMEGLTDMHNLLLVVIFSVGTFVTILLGYTLWRFSEKRNANPSKVSHHTFIEIIWTLLPILTSGIMMLSRISHPWPICTPLNMTDRTNSPSIILSG